MRQGTLEANDPRLPEIVDRLKAGASLLNESKALGYSHNGVLRQALREHLGGVVQYDKLMSGRKGGQKGGRRKKASAPAATASEGSK